MLSSEKEELYKKALIVIDKANSKKIELLNKMNHDIRTPLNAIVGYSNLLVKSENINDIKEYANKIINSSDYLLNLINDILEIGKIESGKLIINKKEFSLNEMMKEVFLNIDVKGKKIKYISDNKLFDKFVSDKRKIQQVLINIISNAVKYTKENGEINIYVNMLEDNDKYQIVDFCIVDNGIGMSEEVLKTIFNPYSRGNVESIQGTGLGMSITKEIINLLNGEIKIESELNIGSKVSVRLKLEKSEIIDISGMKVLVAEDNYFNREIISLLLNELNVECDIVNNGKELIEKYTLTSNYDLILMDLEMPILNGYDTTKIIRNLDQHIPIIAMSANSFESEKEKAIQFTMNDYIDKPIDINNLKRILFKFYKK